MCFRGYLGIPGGSVVENLPATAGDTRDSGLIPGSGGPPGGGNGNPLEYSFLKIPINRGAWAGYSSKGHKEADTNEHTHVHIHRHYINMLFR